MPLEQFQKREGRFEPVENLGAFKSFANTNSVTGEPGNLGYRGKKS